MKALAKEGFTAASFGLDEQQLRHHLDPRNELELFELYKIDPKGREPFWRYLSENHKAASEKFKNGPRPNGHAANNNGSAPELPRVITLTPYVWRAPETLPMRGWLYGKHYIRKFLCATMAAGGLGKSSLDLVEAIAMASGINLLGVPVQGRLCVAYWGEDPKDEIERRIAAILKHFKISREKIEGWLFVDSFRMLVIIGIFLIPIVAEALMWGTFPFIIDSEGVSRLRLIPFIPWPSGDFGYL